MEKDIMKEVNKKIRRGIIIMAIVGIVFGLFTGVVAYSYSAENITFNPNNSNWKVSNVSDAIKSLKEYKTSENYSEDEQVVGTWIDGKPLYQKTWKDLNKQIPQDTWVEVIQLPNDTDKLVNVIQVASPSDMVLGIIEFNKKSNGYLEAHNFAGGSRTIGEITVQYTKTTDSGNSNNS